MVDICIKFKVLQTLSLYITLETFNSEENVTKCNNNAVHNTEIS